MPYSKQADSVVGRKWPSPWIIISTTRVCRPINVQPTNCSPVDQWQQWPSNSATFSQFDGQRELSSRSKSFPIQLGGTLGLAWERFLLAAPGTCPNDSSGASCPYVVCHRNPSSQLHSAKYNGPREERHRSKVRPADQLCLFWTLWKQTIHHQSLDNHYPPVSMVSLQIISRYRSTNLNILNINSV